MIASSTGAEVAFHVARDALVPAALREEGRGRRRERKAGDLRAETVQPFAEPCAFEPGVAGHEHASATVTIVEQVYHTFQGALPLRHRPLRYCISW